MLRGFMDVLFPLLILCCGLIYAKAVFADLVLVKEGKAAAAIVLQAQPSEAAQLAATKLQHYVHKMSGATLPIIQEPQPVPNDFLALKIISGRAGEAPKEEQAPLAPEELRLQATPAALLLIGCDWGPTGYKLKGTLWAALELLERLGCRWLWPGEIGEVVPQRQTITVPADWHYRYVPPIIQRHIRALRWNERQQPGLEKLGITREQYEAFLQKGYDWWLHNRNGTQGEMNYGHAYGDYWERFGKTHPDWFALQPNGSRDQSHGPPDRARLCVSNPELHRQIAADVIAKLKANPSLLCASISPNDGGPQTFCVCPHCEAWDAKDGPIIDIPRMTPDGKHVALTDRYVKFYNAIAELVAKEMPDRKLGAYAYSAYRTPPVHVTLHPNIFIGYVGFTYLNEAARKQCQEEWRAWAKAAPGGLFLRPNLFMTGMGFPVFYPHRLGEDLKMCAQTGMKVTDFDTCFNHWALNGINYYVTIRLLWDPSRDVEEIIRDYCEAGFGPAAEPVRRYFKAVEKMCDRLAASNEYQGYKVNQGLLAAQFTEAFLAELHGYLEEAKQRAGKEEIIQKRIEFLRIGLNYARLNRDYVLTRDALRAGQGDRTALQAAHEAAAKAKFEYMKSLGLNWGINAAYLMFYGV